MNDRDDKDHYEGHDDSEYHFSEDEVSYEVEPEATKPQANVTKESFANRLSGSRRMLISIAVFLVLIFIVYKMVAPTSNTPNTNIAPTTVAQTTPPKTTTMHPNMQVPQPGSPAMQMANQANPALPNLSEQQQAVNPQLSGMPSVIPVQSNIPGQAQSPVAGQMVNMQSESEKLMTQMQADYQQKLTDFATQNKVLQDQVLALSARVTTMETQMNQLIQTLSRQIQNMVANSPTQAAAQEQPKLAYNVQAIIPGRAWLRSENGETITVAEGDMIKELGRVSKIDPYDGVVEINTGSKVVSLSYGNGG